MRKELLNHRPTSALRGQSPLCESVGTGHTSTHPSIFTKILLVLLITLLLPSTAWGQITTEFTATSGSGTNFTVSSSTTEVDGSHAISTGTDLWIIKSVSSDHSIQAKTNGLGFGPIDSYGKTRFSFTIESQFGIKGKFVKAEIYYIDSYLETIQANVCRVNKDDSRVYITSTSQNLTSHSGLNSTSTTGELLASASDEDDLLFDGNKIDIDFVANTIEESHLKHFTISKILLYFEDATYGITVNGISLGTTTDFSTFLNGKLAFSPSVEVWDETQNEYVRDPATLTLNETTDITSISTNRKDLGIHLKGTNAITSGTTSGILSTAKVTDGKLKFSAEEEGSLTINNDSENGPSVIKGFANITGLDFETHTPCGIAKSNDDNDFFLCDLSSSTASGAIHWVKISEAETYPLWIGETQVTSINDTNILGNNTVSFANNTLTLDNAEINSGVYWNDSENLTIALNGENSITNEDGDVLKSFVVFVDQPTTGPSLIFKKADNADSGKLTLTTSNDWYTIKGFGNHTGLYDLGETDIDEERTRVIISSLLSGGSGTSEDPFIITTAQDLKDFSSYISRGVLSNEYFSIGDVDEDGINCEELTDFEPIDPFTGTFDGNNKTIKNLTIISEEGNHVGLFGQVNGGTVKNLTLDNLTIEGGNEVGGIAGTLYGDNGKITNCVVNGSKISCSNSAGTAYTGGIVGQVAYCEVSYCQVSSSTITAVSNATQNATTITAGGIAGFNEGGNINNCEVKGSTKAISNFPEELSMYIYAGAVIGLHNTGNSSSTAQANVYESSVTTTVCGEEYKDQTQRGFGQDKSSGYDVLNQVMMAGTKKITISATGLNDSRKVELGTIAAGTYYFTETEGEGTNSKLKALYTLTDNNMVLQVTSEAGYKPTFTLSDETVVTPTEAFENGAWTIQYAFSMPANDVTATVAFAKDLESKDGETYLYTLEPDQESYAYTGEPIEPTISWVDADPDVVLVKGTDYEVKDYWEVKEGVATPMYEEDGTTPKAPVNVGSYKISITGKGDYSGTRELEFSITKRAVNWSEDKWTSPEAKTDLKYTGADMELVTAATVPEGVTIKYYTKYSSEQFSDYDYSESQDEEWSEEVPTGKEIGYYAVFYKVEGGDNYQDWGPCEVGIAVNIDKDEVTITAENQEVTYNATAQEYDISKVVVDNENAKVVVTYYATAEDLEGGTALAEAPTNAGIYYVRVTLNEESQQHYVAEPADATFTINQLSLEGAEITLNYTELTYNGSEQTVSVTKVEVNGIVVDSDNYLVDDNKGTEAREYTVTVTAKPDNDNFKNNFVGSAEKVWKINHRTASATELGFESETQTSSTYYNPNESFNLPEGYVAYIITGVNGTEVLTTRVSYIPKGVAVLVEKGTSSDEATENITNTDLLPLKGTVEPLDVISITGGTVYVLYNGEFVKSTSGTIPAHRCYLLVATSVAAGTRSFSIDHGDGTTGIKGVKSDEVKGEKWTDDKWHDMQGRSIEKPTKAGLYIKNGKKVVIK